MTTLDTIFGVILGIYAVVGFIHYEKIYNYVESNFDNPKEVLLKHHLAWTKIKELPACLWSSCLWPYYEVRSFKSIKKELNVIN